MTNALATATFQIAYQHQGPVNEFEIHAHDCSDLAKCPTSDITFHEVTSIDEFVTAEVETYESQDQGWGYEFFTVHGCARKVEEAAQGDAAIRNFAAAEVSAQCDHITGCDVPEHTSLDCYYRYVDLEAEPGSEVMNLATWSIVTARTDAELIAQSVETAEAAGFDPDPMGLGAPEADLFEVVAEAIYNPADDTIVG